MRRRMRNMRCGMPELQQSAPASLKIAVTSSQTVSEHRFPATSFPLFFLPLAQAPLAAKYLGSGEGVAAVKGGVASDRPYL